MYFDRHCRLFGAFRYSFELHVSCDKIAIARMVRRKALITIATDQLALEPVDGQDSWSILYIFGSTEAF